MTTHPTGHAGGAPAAADPLPLTEAKLAPPRPPAGLIERPRIMEALDSGDEAALTLVAAPAGYGKTTAVRAWAASRNAALAWVTLGMVLVLAVFSTWYLAVPVVAAAISVGLHRYHR